MPISLIVLAAGMGTRMNSDRAKVLHHLAAAPLLHHALNAGRSVDPSRIIVVAGHDSAAVAKSAALFDESVEVVVQDPQLGTANAVAAAIGASTGPTIGIPTVALNAPEAAWAASLRIAFLPVTAPMATALTLAMID